MKVINRRRRRLRDWILGRCGHPNPDRPSEHCEETYLHSGRHAIYIYLPETGWIRSDSWANEEVGPRRLGK